MRIDRGLAGFPGGSRPDRSPMKTRTTSLLIVLVTSLATATSAAATMVPVYSDSLDSPAARSRVLRLTGRSCHRRGVSDALTITVGKRTEDCAYRTPVIGRNLEVAAVARLLAQTPRAVARKSFLGVALRAGGGTRYEMRIFPSQRKVQLLRSAGADTSYLAIAKRVAGVRGIGAPNVLRLQAEGDRGRVKLTARLGRVTVAEAVDEGPTVAGEYSAVSVGAPRNGRGAQASFRRIVVRVPVRF